MDEQERKQWKEDYNSWRYLRIFRAYLESGRRQSEYVKLFVEDKERLFLESCIKGLKKESDQLKKLIATESKEIISIFEKGNLRPLDRRKVSLFRKGKLIIENEDEERLTQLLKQYPYHYTIDVFKDKIYVGVYHKEDGPPEDFTYESLIKELEHRLRNLPKSDEEIAQLIEERTDTTAQERQTIKDKLSWMVELGIIDYLRDTYKPHFDKDNRLAEFVAKIIGEKQRTVQKYLNSHKEWQELDNENFRKVLMKEGINRKQP